MCLILWDSKVQKNPAAVNMFMTSYFKMLIEEKASVFQMVF